MQKTIAGPDLEQRVGMHLVSGIVVRSCLVLLALGVSTGCDLDVSSNQAALQASGAWSPSASTLAAGDAQFVARDAAGNSCTSGMTDGALALKGYLLNHFGHLPEIQGFACRVVAGSSSLSVHSVGRALDIMIPPVGEDGSVSGSDADNELGDPIAAWLIEHAEEVGVQYIVWDQKQWSGRQNPGQKLSSYGGSNPHVDHIHVELTIAASQLQTPFFVNGLPPSPEIPSCEPIPADGAILEVFGPCVDFRDEVDASNRAWRTVAGGFGGATRYTGGWQNSEPEAEVDYMLSFETSGLYELEVYLDPNIAEFSSTHYTIHSAEGARELDLDQGANAEWTSLGEYRFEAGVPYLIELIDNQSSAEVYDGSGRISVDALRVSSNSDPNGDGDEGGEGEQEGDEDMTDADKLKGGCSSSGSGSSLGFALLCLLAIRLSRMRLQRIRD